MNPQLILSTPILDTLRDERSKFEHKLLEKMTPNAPAIQQIIFPPGVADLEEEEIDEEDENDVPKEDEIDVPKEELIEKGEEGQKEELQDEIYHDSIHAEFSTQLNPVEQTEEETDENGGYQQAMIHEVKNTPYTDRVKSDFYANIYQFAVNELLRIAEIIHLDPNYIQTRLDSFLYGDPTELPFMRYFDQPPNSFWRLVYSSGKEWESFADLALRYSTVFVTETIVERAFSQQHYIQHQRMTHISSSVMKALLLMH